MSNFTISFTADVWEHDGEGSWHFVNLPEAHADDIKERFGRQAAGFGSIRVQVTMGTSVWKTSLFPDTKRGTYVLPIKKAVRTAEGLRDGSTAKVKLKVLIDT